MTEHRLVDREDAPDDIEYEDVGPQQRWTFALDQDGDIIFNEQLQTIPTVHAENAVKQSLNVALGTVRGEDPLDDQFGLNVFNATRSFRQIEREIRKTLIYDDKDHDRVEAVTNVDITRLSRRRRAHVTVELRLDTGEIEELELDLGVAL